MKKACFLAAAALMITAQTARADVFEYGNLVIAGDEENTYVYDTEKEADQTEKIYYYPPSGNFCLHEDKLYFDADEELLEYSFDTGKAERLGSIGGGFSVKPFFAGILDNRLYYTVNEGYTENENNLKYLDLETGGIHDFDTDVYGACVFEDTLFLVKAVPDQENPEEKKICFGSVSEDFSNMKVYSWNAVYTENPQGKILWADQDALYYQEFEVDEKTGENTKVCLKKVRKDPENGFVTSTYGFVDDPEVRLEYLGTAGGNLFIRGRYPDEEENFVALQNLSDDTLNTLVFNGKSGTNGQNDAELFFSGNAVYYMAEDSSLWQLELSENEDHLIGRFPENTILQGVTETDVYYVCGGSLFASPLAEFTMSEEDEAEETQDPAELVGEIEEALQKTAERCTPSPYILPEILKKNPQVGIWLNAAEGKDLHASLALDTGIDISADKEGRNLSLRFSADGKDLDYQVEIPEFLYSGALPDLNKYSLEYLLEDRKVTREDGVYHSRRLSDDLITYEESDIPCRIFRTSVSWEKTGEIVQDIMSGLSGLFEELSIDTERIPDIEEYTASLEELASDGISLVFYVTEEGCIRVEVSAVQNPGVTGVYGQVPERKRIAKYDDAPGFVWSADILQDSRIFFGREDVETNMDVSVRMLQKTRNGSFSDLTSPNLSFCQFKDDMGYHEEVSFPISGYIRDNTGTFSIRYIPENNAVFLSFHLAGDKVYFSLFCKDPEVSGNVLRIPVTLDGVPDQYGKPSGMEGILEVKYKE